MSSFAIGDILEACGFWARPVEKFLYDFAAPGL
jgi:hypothetical protein